ncbi:MAG: protein kinase domain-containing protein, partial [bacterium]
MDDALDVPEIADASRYFPEPVLVGAPEVRSLADGGAEVRVPATGAWRRVHPLWLAVLEGLVAGASFREVQERLPPIEGVRPKQGRALARHYLWQMHRFGIVQLALPEPPDVWRGRYRRVRELGRGSLGVAHLCLDLDERERPVVLKHPWGVLHPIDRGQRAIAREVRALRLLDHPGVPRLVDSFAVDGLLHLVRDHVEGEDLHRSFSGKPPDEAERRAVAGQVAEVVAHAHGRGLLLLDIAPANFLRRPDGRVLLIDLGTSVPHQDGSFALAAAVGSPGYVAPEMIRPGAGAGPAGTLLTEVFAFGRLVAFLASGRA